MNPQHSGPLTQHQVGMYAVHTLALHQGLLHTAQSFTKELRHQDCIETSTIQALITGKRSPERTMRLQLCDEANVKRKPGCLPRQS